MTIKRKKGQQEMFAILLLVAMAIAGVVLTFNLIPSMGIEFNHNSAMAFFWSYLLRIVIGPLLVLLPIWVIYNMIKEGL